MEGNVFRKIFVEHFEVEKPEDQRFAVQINVTGWSDSAPDADEPEVFDVVLDKHDAQQLIKKLEDLLDA